MRATVAVLGSGLCCLHLWALRGIMAVESQPGEEVCRAAWGGWAGAPVTVQGGWGTCTCYPPFPQELTLQPFLCHTKCPVWSSQAAD